MVNAIGDKTGGRSKGTPNKVTKDIRDDFATFLHYASPKIKELWETLLEDNPKEALAVVRDYAEFVLPKLARVDNRLVDEDGKDRDINVTVNKIIAASEKCKETK